MNDPRTSSHNRQPRFDGAQCALQQSRSQQDPGSRGDNMFVSVRVRERQLESSSARSCATVWK